MDKKKTFPHMGKRIMKSAIAVALCFAISFIRGDSGIVFYSQLAAIWCIQAYTVDTWKSALQRMLGTVIGALYGLLFLLGKGEFAVSGVIGKCIDAAFISIMIVVILYTTVVIHKKQASYFSCVVFLSIVVNHLNDANPYLFVWNRFLDTTIGIIVGIFVNSFSLPKNKQKDVLFVSGLDDLLINEQERLSDYSRVQLNRMIDDGANFTVSTVRTPAAIMELMSDVRLSLPVVAMDGAVLYDIREHEYKKVYVISKDKAKELLTLIHRQGLKCFTNVIIDDTLVIYYEDMEDEIQRSLVNKLRHSPYRNYIKRPVPESEDVVYIMLFDKYEKIKDFYLLLEEKGYSKELKIEMYNSVDTEGYSYLKMFNRNASKKNMINYLKEESGLTKTVTFGSVPDEYDVVVESGNINKLVHILKRLYEPLWKLNCKPGSISTEKGKDIVG